MDQFTNFDPRKSNVNDRLKKTRDIKKNSILKAIQNKKYFDQLFGSKYFLNLIFCLYLPTNFRWKVVYLPSYITYNKRSFVFKTPQIPSNHICHSANFQIFGSREQLVLAISNQPSAQHVLSGFRTAILRRLGTSSSSWAILCCQTLPNGYWSSGSDWTLPCKHSESTGPASCKSRCSQFETISARKVHGWREEWMLWWME